MRTIVRAVAPLLPCLLAACSSSSHAAEVPEDPGGIQQCGTASNVTPGTVAVVFDQSNSMGQSFSSADGGVGTMPKWKAARDALSAAITPIEDQLRLGAIFFPTEASNGSCGSVDAIDAATQIGFMDGPTFVGAWGKHFSAGWHTILGTPLLEGLKRASDALPGTFDRIGPVVVVLTDGAPTCEVAGDIIGEVQGLHARGIRTFVVGLPGSANAQSLLDGMAKAGGTGGWLTPTEPQALEGSLSTIAQAAVDPCSFHFSPAPPESATIVLSVTDSNGATQTVEASDAGDGWELAADRSGATLTGSLCDRVTSKELTEVQFQFFCGG